VLLSEFPSPLGRTTVLDDDLDVSGGGPARGHLLHLGFDVADAAVDAHGVLHVVGTGPGVSFHAAGETPGPSGGYVARIPLGGGLPPSDLRARPLPGGDVSLRWSADGEGAVAYEIERIVADAPPEVVATAEPDATALRVRGLPPGSHQRLRVVSVLSDGRRVAGPLREATTFLVPPRAVVATRGPGHAVEIAWDEPNGDAAHYEIERRIGPGRWTATRTVGDPSLRSIPTTLAEGSPHADLVPGVAAPVRWRVRAVHERRRTRWVESSDLSSEPALRVVPTAGNFGYLGDGPTRFEASGTLSSRDGTTLPAFSPATEELRLLFGALEAPEEFVVPAGDPGWTSAPDGVLRWSPGRTLPGWDRPTRVVLDVSRGTFEIRLRRTYADFRPPSRSVVLDLSLGDRNGGHVGRWRRTTPSFLQLGGRHDARAPR